MSPSVLEILIDLVRRHPVEACFHHVKAYRGEELLFTFHDAFDGSCLLVSDRVPEESVRAFASPLGGTYQRELNASKQDPEELLRVFRALENAHKSQMNRPWSKKALFFWKR
jgi:hypothetical protein